MFSTDVTRSNVYVERFETQTLGDLPVFLDEEGGLYERVFAP